MYLRESRRTNEDGSVVAYLQTGNSVAKVAERVAIDLQPRAATRTPTSSRTRGTTTPNGTSA